MSQITVAGWGDTVGVDTTPSLQGSLELQKTSQSLQPYFACYKAGINFGTMYNDRTQFCAYADMTDSCVGDSGGPAMAIDESTGQYTLFGVVSFGASICAKKDTPAFYIRLIGHHDWIGETIAKAEKDKKWDTWTEISQKVMDRQCATGAGSRITNHCWFTTLSMILIITWLTSIHHEIIK